MKGKEIKELQNRLFFHLEPYFSSKGFKMDKKAWNVIGDHHTINLYVNTTHFDSYTLRPGITIFYKSIFDTIQDIVKTDDFQIFHNGNFDIYQKLANVFDIHKFDLCNENRENKFNSSFTIEVEYDNTYKVANRLIEFMESFGWKTIESTDSLENLYNFYKKVMILFLNDYKNEPTKKVTEYPIVLDVNAYFTMAYLGIQKIDQEILEIISSWNNIQNERPYWVEPINKIINHSKL